MGTPRQRLAIAQELENQKLGLAPFSDPTPWQRLSREQQEEFNRKYLALRPDLQEYSRDQFLSLPEDRQAHAFHAFLSVDIQTLSLTIERERDQHHHHLQANQHHHLLPADQHQHHLSADKQDRIVQKQHQPEEQNLADKQLEVVIEKESINITKSNDEQKEIDELF